jgi:transcriptional/translational regulatory protein YebC/TACO1
MESEAAVEAAGSSLAEIDAYQKYAMVDENRGEYRKLIEALEDHEDVQNVTSMMSLR